MNTLWKLNGGATMLPVMRKNNNSALTRKRDLFEDFDEFLNGFWSGQTQWTNMIGSMDLYEDKDAIHVDCDLPGFNKDEINLTIEDGVLNISAEHKEDTNEKKDGSYYVRERRHQSFSRSVKLPHNIQQDKIHAEYTDGVLKIKMDVPPEKKPQTITIK